jgi:DNA replication protein DnaC
MDAFKMDEFIKAESKCKDGDCRKQFMARIFQFEMGGRTRRIVVDEFCPDCKMRLKIKENGELEEAIQKQKHDTKLRHEQEWKKLCPAEFRTADEGGTSDISRIRREQPKFVDVMQWGFGPKGLIIRGQTGTRKTRAMWRLLRRLFDENKSVIAMTAVEFDRQCRDAGGQFFLDRWFKELATIHVLMIDDLGKGNWTQGTEAQWFDLVDTRTREHRPILITTQEDRVSLAAKMSENRGEALVRRLGDYCNTIIFK